MNLEQIYNSFNTFRRSIVYSINTTRDTFDPMARFKVKYSNRFLAKCEQEFNTTLKQLIQQNSKLLAQDNCLLQIVKPYGVKNCYDLFIIKLKPNDRH